MTRPPILIAQITDLHIKRPGKLAYGKVDTATALQRLVVTLNALRPQPDLVVISGDLVDNGTAEEYAYLVSLLEPLTIPLAVMPGNHDCREPMRAIFPKQPFAQMAALNQIRRVGDIDIIALDSSVTGKPHGELDPATLAWLDKALSVDPSRPAIIFLHHPPFKTGIWHMDSQNLCNADDLATIVRQYPQVALVAAGHVHRATFTRFAGTLASICPAPSHAVQLDLAQMIAPSFAIEPAAFHLHAWLGGHDGLVTHHIPVGRFDGPHPFFGGDGKLL